MCYAGAMAVFTCADLVTCERCGRTEQLLATFSEALVTPNTAAFLEAQRERLRREWLSDHPCLQRNTTPDPRVPDPRDFCHCGTEFLDQQTPWVVYPDYAHTGDRCGGMLSASMRGFVIADAAATRAASLEVTWADGTKSTSIATDPRRWP